MGSAQCYWHSQCQPLVWPHRFFFFFARVEHFSQDAVSKIKLLEALSHRPNSSTGKWKPLTLDSSIVLDRKLLDSQLRLDRFSSL